MRTALDRYVRSLAERENANDAPEHVEDLGTFVDWLLERQGFSVRLRAYKHEGTERRKSAGRLQLGADILATKPDEDGVQRLYRFVLKEGPVGRAALNHSGEVGNIFSDIHEAARRNRRRDAEDHDVSREDFDRVSVVAVHNGDFDAEVAGGTRKEDSPNASSARATSTSVGGMRVGFVRLALLRPADGSAPLDEAGDASFFAPALQPYVRLALDGIRVRSGGAFDLTAIDGLLQAMLPVRTRYDAEERAELAEAPPIEAIQVRRLLGALVMLVEMLRVEVRAAAGGLTLPVLDSIERILAHVTIYLGAVDPASGHVRFLRAHLATLVDQYVRTAATLRERLTSLLVRPNMLVLNTHSESVDYPLRALRFLGYLATAGLAQDLAKESERAEAEGFADAIQSIWKSEREACSGPVTDDQGIELGLVLELLLRLDRKVEAASVASDVALRFVIRRQHGAPLPAVSQHARVPMSDHDIRDLLEAYTGSDRSSIEDGASTILPMMLFVLERLGLPTPDEVLSAFQEREGPDGRRRKACHLQAWQPPHDAGRRWYLAGGTRVRGLAKVFMTAPAGFVVPGYNVATIAELAADFASFAQPIDASISENWGFPVVDRMAWKLHRVRPPMRLFVDLLADGGSESSTSESTQSEAADRRTGGANEM